MIKHLSLLPSISYISRTNNEIFLSFFFKHLMLAIARRDVRFKNLESLIRDVSCHLEDQSNIRAVVGDVADCTVGGAIYRRPRGSSARGCIVPRRYDLYFLISKTAVPNSFAMLVTFNFFSLW